VASRIVAASVYHCRQWAGNMIVMRTFFCLCEESNGTMVD
jgi:hypothetical protein